PVIVLKIRYHLFLGRLNRNQENLIDNLFCISVNGHHVHPCYGSRDQRLENFLAKCMSSNSESEDNFISALSYLKEVFCDPSDPIPLKAVASPRGVANADCAEKYKTWWVTIMLTNPTSNATVSDAAHREKGTWAQDQMCIHIDTVLTKIFNRFVHAHAIAFILACLALSSRNLSSSSTSLEFQTRGTLQTPELVGSSPISLPRQTNDGCIGPLVVTPQVLVQFTNNLSNLQSTDGENLLQAFIQEINVQYTTFSTVGAQVLISALVSRSVSLNIPAYQQLTRQFSEHLSASNGACWGRKAQSLSDKTLGLCLSAPAGAIARNPKRTHLEQQITRARISCTHTTERGVSPLTLFVVKQYIIQAEVDKWKKHPKELYITFA
ncbi:hypothetical protein PSTT_14225, partial [Puccinia striiformis]